MTPTALNVRPGSPLSVVGRKRADRRRRVRGGEVLQRRRAGGLRARRDRLRAQERDHALDGAAAQVRCPGPSGPTPGHGEQLRVRVLRGGAARVLQRRPQVGAAGEHEHRDVRAEVGDALGLRRRRPLLAQAGGGESSTVLALNGAKLSACEARKAFSASVREATGESGAHGSRASMHEVASSRAMLTPPLVVLARSPAAPTGAAAAPRRRRPARRSRPAGPAQRRVQVARRQHAE